MTIVMVRLLRLLLLLHGLRELALCRSHCTALIICLLLLLCCSQSHSITHFLVLNQPAVVSIRRSSVFGRRHASRRASNARVKYFLSSPHEAVTSRISASTSLFWSVRRLHLVVIVIVINHGRVKAHALNHASSPLLSHVALIVDPFDQFQKIVLHLVLVSLMDVLLLGRVDLNLGAEHGLTVALACALGWHCVSWMVWVTLHLHWHNVLSSLNSLELLA